VKIRWKRAVPVVLSAVVLPGLGQLYMRRYARGAILAGVFLGIFLYMTLQMMHTAMAVSPSAAAFSPYLAELLEECLSSFMELSRSWLPLLAAVWGYSLVDTVRLAWRWKPDGEAPEQA